MRNQEKLRGIKKICVESRKVAWNQENMRGIKKSCMELRKVARNQESSRKQAV